jgi:hypothetical protein
MKIIAHTPQGTFESIDFESVDKEGDEQDYLDACNLLSKIGDVTYFTFETDKGSVYFPKQLIQQSVFVIEK